MSTAQDTAVVDLTSDLAFNENVRRVVKVLLAWRGLRTEDLAEPLQVSAATAYKRVLGNSSFKAAEIARLADFFDVSPSAFYEPADDLVSAKSR